MKVQKIFALFVLGSSLMFLSACNTVGTKFTSPDVDKLEFGKMQTSDAIALFGKPHSTVTKTTIDGNYEVYKYQYAAAGFSSIQERVLLLEFKEGKLNAYYVWSSFDNDRTKFDPKAVVNLKAGIGKLTKNDVLVMVGKPDAKGLCPSILADFKDRCAKNTEIWGWYMTDNFNLWANMWVRQNLKTAELYVSFDANGNISDVEFEESNTK